jgi:hypothetical protein
MVVELIAGGAQVVVAALIIDFPSGRRPLRK